MRSWALSHHQLPGNQTTLRLKSTTLSLSSRPELRRTVVEGSAVGPTEPLLRSIPAPIAGCPTSRSFFARCGIPRASPLSLWRVPQIRRGAPCSHQRTWAENDRRPQISYFALLARAACAALLKE